MAGSRVNAGKRKRGQPDSPAFEGQRGLADHWRKQYIHDKANIGHFKDRPRRMMVATTRVREPHVEGSDGGKKVSMIWCKHPT